jgi:hypothetical protein
MVQAQTLVSVLPVKGYEGGEEEFMFSFHPLGEWVSLVIKARPAGRGQWPLLAEAVAPDTSLGDWYLDNEEWIEGLDLETLEKHHAWRGVSPSWGLCPRGRSRKKDGFLSARPGSKGGKDGIESYTYRTLRRFDY